MSLPLRSSVWSAESEPGTAGSGICLTQTATFMRLLFLGANRRTAPVRGTTIVPIHLPCRRNVQHLNTPQRQWEGERARGIRAKERRQTSRAEGAGAD